MKRAPKIISLEYLQNLVREQEKKEEKMKNKITFVINSNRDE
jgi:hypothetical protein